MKYAYMIAWNYLFRNKHYPAALYNIYGSEGHSPDRHYVDEMIKEKGFWRAAWIIWNEKVRF